MNAPGARAGTAPLRSPVLDSPVGPLVVVADAAAVLRIEWAAPAATVDRGACAPTDALDPLLARALEQLAEYFAGARRAFDLPLAPAGSAFQRRAWAEMARIPWGETLSYGALARRIGASARAVGGACAANPIPIVIPCHRVLAGGGRLGGYSGGAGPATKAALLRLEGVGVPEPDLFALAARARPVTRLARPR